ncbi:MAG: hypothetical protein AAGK23_12345 [Pseudomonadota bacterium]
MHRYLAGRIKDKPDNSNRRFAIAAGMNYTVSKGPFPFWGAPAKEQAKTLSSKKGDFASGRLSEFRLAELYLKKSGRGNPKSCWQLAYTGSVGSQSLMGIPHVHKLRDTLEAAKLWPFETGLRSLDEEALAETKTLICEIYPSAVDVTPEPGEIIDRAQVRTIANYYSELDAKGTLGACFGAPDSLDTGKIEQIEQEEGWILVK